VTKEASYTGGVAGAQLTQIIERDRASRRGEEAGIADDIKEVFAEAKGNGFDTKTIRSIIRIRKKDPPSSRKRKPCSSSTSARSAS
jgi:uncharacterized protein (UPF0335 family)